MLKKVMIFKKSDKNKCVFITQSYFWLKNEKNNPLYSVDKAGFVLKSQTNKKKMNKKKLFFFVNREFTFTHKYRVHIKDDLLLSNNLSMI